MSAENDLKKIVKDIKTVIKRSLSPREMRLIALKAVFMIRKRTRKGFGVRRHGARQTRLKRLSRSYIEQRKNRRRDLDGTSARQAHPWE